VCLETGLTLPTLLEMESFDQLTNDFVVSE